MVRGLICVFLILTSCSQEDNDMSLINFITASASQEETFPNNGVYVYIETGQSTSQGTADIVDTPASELVSVPNVYIWNDDLGTPAFEVLAITGVAGSNQKSYRIESYGHEARIAQRWSEISDKPLYIIKEAQGGTLIQEHLSGGTVYPDVYDNNIVPGINALINLGLRPFVIGFDFAQGEADALTQINTDAYDGRQNTYISEYRSNLGSNIPFILCGTKISATDPVTRAEINLTKSDLATSDAFVYYVSKDTASSYDGTHLDYAGTKVETDFIFEILKTTTPVEITGLL